MKRTAVSRDIVEHKVKFVLLGATAGEGGVTRAGRGGLVRGLVHFEERLTASAQALVSIGNDEEQVGIARAGLETSLPVKR